MDGKAPIDILILFNTNAPDKGSNEYSTHYSPTGIYPTIIAPQGYIGN